MDIKDFKPTAYRYRLKDGRDVLGESFIDGIKYYLVDSPKGKVMIKTPGLDVECLDANFGEDRIKVPLSVSTNHDHVSLEERIALLDARIKNIEDIIDSGKIKI